MAIEASRLQVEGAKFDSFVAMKYLSLAAFAIGGRCIEIIYSVGNGDIDQLIDSFLVYIVAAVSGTVVRDGRPAHASVTQ